MGAWRSSPSEVCWGTFQRSWVEEGASLWCQHWLRFAWANRGRERAGSCREQENRTRYSWRGKVSHVMRVKKRGITKGKKGTVNLSLGCGKVWDFGNCMKLLVLFFFLFFFWDQAWYCQSKVGNEEALRVQLNVSAWWWQQHTYLNTHTPHTVATTTFMMRSHLLLENNGESNKRKKKNYFGVVNGEKKR